MIPNTQPSPRLLAPDSHAEMHPPRSLAEPMFPKHSPLDGHDEGRPFRGNEQPEHYTARSMRAFYRSLKIKPRRRAA